MIRAANVGRYYSIAVDELLKLSARVELDPESEVFSFSDSMRMSEKSNAILRGLYSAVYQEIRRGVIAEWEFANLYSDAMIESIFGPGLQEDNHYARWFSRNHDAMDAFFKRKSEYGGLNLSQKVWKYTSQFKEEMELSLSASLGRGDSAATVSRHVRQYLQEPDRLFRRVRDEEGNLKLSKRAAAYHPGRGEYRSSYKNAMRLARTETNMAYRAADNERWSQLDFVVGIEVKRSKRKFPCKICETLAGKFPKDFDFRGWHPQCRCYAVPILCSMDEMVAMQKRLLNDEEPGDLHSANEVTEPHADFKKWVKDNEESISKAKSLPYFLKDNQQYAGIKNKGSVEHSESEQIRHLGVQGNLAHKETKASEMRNDVPMKPLKPEPGVLEYTRKQAEQIGAKMTEPMPYNKADKGYANTCGDDVNCQSTVVAFFARLLGMDVTAAEYKYGGEFVKRLENNQALAYYISPNKKVHPTPSRKLMSVGEVLEYIDKETAKNGIYNLAINKWKNRKDGHIMCLIKSKGEAYLVDIQSGKRVDLTERLSLADFVFKADGNSKGVELLRVDKFVLSDEALQVLRPSK